MAIQAIPEQYNTITCYLICPKAASAIDFYQRAFNAELIYRAEGPGDMVPHAEMRIGNSIFMLADEFPDMGAKGPTTLGGSPVHFLIYVEDADAAVAKAVAAGASIDRPVQNQFYGDRSGTVVDPSGHKWSLASHVEDVSPEELQRRMASMHGA